MVVAAISSLGSGGLSLSTLVGLQQPDIPALVAAELAANREDPESNEPATVQPQDVDWQETLIPRGAKTRLGDVVRWLVTKERGGPEGDLK